jgi:hypothetical protein
MTGVKYVMMQSAPEMKNIVINTTQDSDTLRSYKTCFTKHIFWTLQYVILK